MRHIDIFLYDGVNSLDVAGISEAFCIAEKSNKPAYKLRFFSIDGKTVKSHCGLNLAADLSIDELNERGDLLIPGGEKVDAQFGQMAIIELIKNWQKDGGHKRLISICSGALLLAHAGVLNGIRATTHWQREGQAKRDYPLVDWRVCSIFEHSQDIYSSAGVTCGIDLALSLISQDCGNDEALRIARQMVVFIHRSGGQSQFSSYLESQFNNNDGLSKLILNLISNPFEDWTLEKMADVAGLTSRTLSRRFKSSMDISPISFVERVRVRHASLLIAKGNNRANVAKLSGFGSEQRMRRAFDRHVGISPKEYARKFAFC